MERSYYEVIGVSPSASDYEICEMYSKWLKNGQCDDIETKEAYRVLMSSNLRQEYDKSIGIPEKKVPISMLSQEIKNAAEREKAMHGNYLTALSWVVAAGPVVSALLFPGYFIQGAKFPESLMAYAFSAVLFFLAAGLYMILVAVCGTMKSEKSKIISVVALFVACAFFFCILQVWW